MNRRRTILLTVAMTTFALTSSARADMIEPLGPPTTCAVGEGIVQLFAVHLDIGWYWPSDWRAVEWYEDGALRHTENVPRHQAILDTGYGLTWWEPGTHQVKAHAKYGLITEDWTGYVIWNVTVFEHRPIASRVSPDSPVALNQGTTQIFKVQAADDAEDLKGVEWYLDGELQGDFPLSGKTAQPQWSYTFNTLGNHLVEAAVYDVHYYYTHSSRYEPVKVAWTVAVGGEPSGIIVSPSMFVTAYVGVPMTFTLQGTDSADDLELCEVSVDDVSQTEASFTGAATGSTAAWTHTFDTPGEYQVAFVPVDSPGNHGTACTWTVAVEASSNQAQVTGMVIGLNAQGQPQGPLAGADVDLTGMERAITATTDVLGQFAFVGLNPGTYAVNVSKMGYYAAPARDVVVATGETKDEVFQLTLESPNPAAFDFSSPNGKHFLEGLPVNLSFSVVVAWNGSPGSVTFGVAGTSYPATITNLGAGKALASLTIPVPATIAKYSEVTIEVANGEGKTATVNTGVHLYPVPGFLFSWALNSLDILPWEAMGETKPYTFKMGQFYTLWDTSGPSAKVSTKGTLGYENQLTFDPWAGRVSGSTGGYGKFDLTIKTTSVEVLGEARLDLNGGLTISFAGSESPEMTGNWKLSLSGKAGVGAPVVNAISVMFPAAAPAINSLREFPITRELVDSLKVRLYLIGGGALSGKYEGELGDCFLGATSVSASVTLGVEAQVVVALKKWGWKLEAGVYAGGTGTPEWKICPEPIEFQGVTLRAYVGVFVTSWSYRFAREVAMTIRFGPGGEKELLAIASIPGSSPEGEWQPIGDSCLRWGQMNVLADETGSGGRLRILSVRGEVSEETRLVENVVSLASPVLLSGPTERFILFSLHDPNKPWYAATDIGTLRQKEDQPWALDRITDDQAAEFGPSVVAVDSHTALAAWERVSGDISDANGPDQVAPHMEIVAASFDPNTGLWSTPQQLTSNAVADHQPVPITLGTTSGILWIQNEGGAVIGDANSGDRLMFAKWSGTKWDQPQVLWSAKKGLLDYAFVADSLGEGHVVLAVDEDGDPNTTADCELYLLSTANGAWQTATQLTSDFAEDAMPTLVAPNGVPTCVWSADKTLVYSQLRDWNPREVYREYTLANEAPSLAGVTMPGGAAIAYTVQGPNGVDIVASFYDADLDCWSLPRQLTNDEHGETSLSLSCDANELVIAYLKTQTVRTAMDVEIEGQMQRLENIPQPGRTDLYVLRHALANDLAAVSESMVVDPANPAPGTAATIRATIENRGDLPLQDVVAVFYDGDPSNGGAPIGDRQVIAGTMIAGGKQDISVSWNVPRNESSRRIFVVVDPCLAVEDRDRSNNVLSLQTVLPDLAIETCWSTEVSSTMMALTARVVNKGVIPAGAFDLSWRLGAPDGEEIGTGMIEPLISGGAHEVSFMWDTTGRLEPGQHVQVFAVVDPARSVPESDETNNAYSLAVFHAPVVSPGAP